MAAAERVFHAKVNGALSKRMQAMGRKVISLIRKMKNIVASCKGLHEVYFAIVP